MNNQCLDMPKCMSIAVLMVYHDNVQQHCMIRKSHRISNKSTGHMQCIGTRVSGVDT